MNVVIINYGMGNLNSVYRAFEECGANVTISENPNDLIDASHIVLPGVGAFKDAMKNLEQKEWSKNIRQAVLEKNIPIIGICLGMQLLATESYEGGKTKGLDLISGKVERLNPENSDFRIPHIGWNEVHKENENILFNGISNGVDFYFVHSFHFIPNNNDDIVAITPYCGEFVSVVSKKRIYGTQFHPEKSNPVGFKLIKNFLEFG